MSSSLRNNLWMDSRTLDLWSQCQWWDLHPRRIWTPLGEPDDLNTLTRSQQKSCPNSLTDAPALGQGP